MVTRNIHPFTDLIIRNWFQTKGLDIDSEFTGSGAPSQMPTQAEIDAIEDEINAIVAQVLADYGVSTDVDLLATPFNADGTGFDAFILNSPVIINNNQITVIVNDINLNIEGIVINGVDLGTDFTSGVDAPPTTPQNVRALAASSSEIIVVWEAATDDKGVAGYNVYQNGSFVATTPYPVYSDTGLSTGTNYSYEIEAVDGCGQVSAKSAATSPIMLDTPDTTAPPAPANLQATAAGNDISLSWDQTQINDVFGFHILRGSAGNVTTEIANITSTIYSDFNLISGTEYCYQVIAYDAAGNESVASNESCATIGGVNPGPSSVSFSATTYTVSENTPSITITVNRAGNISEAISVGYAASNGTAVDVEDFSATSGTLNWAANDSAAKTFAVQIVSDGAIEGNETVSLALSNPSATTSLGANATATLTIADFVVGVCNGEIADRNITVDTTLSEPCYKVPNGIQVSNAATLTVLPGVRLEFAAGQELNVESDGALTAVGTAVAPIVFTGLQQTPGYWDGIHFRNSNNVNNQFDHVVVEYGGGGSGTSSAAANVVFDFSASRLKMRHTTLRHSAKHGLSVNDLAILDAFAENTITANAAAPVIIPADKAGKLDVLSTYSGNGGFDYISIIESGTSGDVNTDQTWNALGVPYRLHTVDVDADAALTIAPGATLIANGTVDKKITFTAEQPTPGYWHGIQFTFNASGNELDHAIVEYCGGTTGNGEGCVSVFSINGRLKIHNTVLRESLRYGFDFDRGIALDMLNVTSTANTEGAGILHPNDVGKLDKNSSYSGNTIDRIVWEGGNISDSQTIQNLGVPYHVGQHRIRGNVSIEPGTELSFASGGGLDIDNPGSLSAVGTAAERIVFTGRQPISGHWDGIHFFTGSLANKLDFTTVEYAGKLGGNIDGLVGVFFQDSRVDVTNSILRESATNGIWLTDNTSGVHTNNTFENILGENIFIAN